MRDSRRRNFYWCDNDFMDKAARIVEPIGVAVYSYLCRRADNDTQLAWPAVPTMAEVLGVTEPTIIKAIKALEACCIVEVIQRYRDDGGRMTNSYRLIDMAEWRLEHGENILNAQKSAEKATKKSKKAGGKNSLPLPQNNLPSPQESLPGGKDGGKNSLPNQYQDEQVLVLNTHSDQMNGHEKNKFFRPESNPNPSEVASIAQILTEARLDVDSVAYYARGNPHFVRQVVAWWKTQNLDNLDNPPGLLVNALEDPGKYLRRPAAKKGNYAPPVTTNGGAYELYSPNSSPQDGTAESMEAEEPIENGSEPVYSLYLPLVLEYIEGGLSIDNLDKVRSDVAPHWDLKYWSRLKEMAKEATRVHT